MLSSSVRFLGFLTSDAADLEELKAQKIVPREKPMRQSVAEQMQVGSGRVGSGRVGSGRVGSGRVGSGRSDWACTYLSI